MKKDWRIGVFLKPGILFFCLSFIRFAFVQSQELTKLDSAVFNAEKKIETDNRNYFKNVGSFIVQRKGVIRLERYFFGADKDSLHQIQSQTKSIVSLLLGIAIDYGYIASENNLVGSYFPGYFRKEDSLKSSIRIKDLITMSAGMKWEEMLAFDDPLNDNSNMYKSRNWLEYSLTRSMAEKPFAEFRYCSGYPMIVAGIIEKSTKMPLEQFAKKYLFDQLDIREFYWEKDSLGFCHASGGLWMRPADVARIGELILQKGKWKNVQIVSENWIERATQIYFHTSFSGYGYGFFFWVKNMKIREGQVTKVISMQGAGGQYLYVFPEYDLVVSFTESNYGTPIVGPFIISNYILPSLE